jgi:hypothetical protein
MSYDPKYLGPGYWASWHIKSLHADTKSKKGEVARNIALDIKNFPCIKCQNHARDYVKNHPLITAVEDKDKLSIFKWIVDFHNEVNLRLNKKVFTYKQAEDLWNGKNFCFENCSENEEEIKEEVVEEEPSEEETIGSVLIKSY